MIKSLLIPTIFALIFASSCKNIYYSGSSLEPNLTFTGTANASLELYVDTNLLLKGTSTSKVVFGIFKIYDNLYSDAYIGGIADDEKRAAMYKALHNTNYDLIVLPKYKIETDFNPFVRKKTVHVEGYGGKYVLKNVNYITNIGDKMNDNNTKRYKETPAYNAEIQKLFIFMAEIANYTPIEIKRPEELEPNQIILTSNNTFGIVLSNNSGMIKYLTSPQSDKYEVQDEHYSKLKKMKKFK